MVDRDRHTMWEIYNLWRTAKLNTKYFAHVLSIRMFWAKAMEITIAVTAPTSAVAALWFWGTCFGSVLWKVLLIIASVCSLLKPILDLPKKSGEIQKTLSGYKLLCHDLEALIIKVRQRSKFDKELMSEFQEINTRKRVLVAEDPLIKTNRKLAQKFYNEVNFELKDYDFYIPEDENA